MSRWMTAALAIFLMSGCGSEKAPAATSPPVDQVFCHHNPVQVAALDAAKPATRLSADGQKALKGFEVGRIDDLHTWTILEDSSTRMALIRKLDKSTPTGKAGGAYEYLLVGWFENLRLGDSPSEGRSAWMLKAHSRCDLRRVPEGLTAAEIALDPAHPAPTPSSRQVELLVTEQACASGRSAVGRVRATVEKTSDEVRLIIGVARSDAMSNDCQGNPATPFTADLGEPLGDRTLIDATVYPPRELKIYPPLELKS